MRAYDILIIDGEPIVRESIREWLARAGYNVEAVGSVDDALEAASEHEIHVAVADHRPDNAGAIDMLCRVKSEHPKITTVLIASQPSHTVEEAAAQACEVDHVLRPFPPDRLERLIRETMRSIHAEREGPVGVGLAPEPLAEVVEPRETFVLSSVALKALFDSLAASNRVFAVVEREGKYSYQAVADFAELSLDFDTTLLPPTRFLFPPRETLLDLRLGASPAAEPVVSEEASVLFGVHPYDLRAIELLDEVFMGQQPDPNYIARRRNTILIGIECLRPSATAFAPSMDADVVESGFDLMLAPVNGDFAVIVGTERGSKILQGRDGIRAPTDAEIAALSAQREAASKRYRVQLSVSRARLPRLLEDYYDDPYWGDRSRTCLSCGSCVMVCPTCFCFDVADQVDLDLSTARRVRRWDGCMLSDFALVASGENFRATREDRFRHRMFRKGKYLVERYGIVGCVGCGRCTTACLPRIASPAEAWNEIAEIDRAERRRTRTLRGKADSYVPHMATLKRVAPLTEREKVFELRLPRDQEVGHQPGQFVMVSVPGIGEAPISIASSPTRRGSIELAIRDTGNVTHAMHGLAPGAVLGVRGPFGNGFPLEALEWRDLILIAGGIGLFPLRSLIQYVADRRDRFGDVTILYGARSPEERVFTVDLAEWSRREDLTLRQTVDQGSEAWGGHVGVITTLIPSIVIQPAKTMAVVVGPPVMYRFVIGELKKKGLADDQIAVSLERHMKCGTGKCGHCQINGIYACQDGPVFTLEELNVLQEAVA
ncbi:MAG: 4Fe-4S dicluster domain-containing protein [Candidatus Bipolaricaulota bacterium]|nr:MAG: 4Fe-4S dicluster domain-containing protein [Candidatus Bipolaricaulota bacterium]